MFKLQPAPVKMNLKKLQFETWVNYSSLVYEKSWRHNRRGKKRILWLVSYLFVRVTSFKKALCLVTFVQKDKAKFWNLYVKVTETLA